MIMVLEGRIGRQNHNMAPVAKKQQGVVLFISLVMLLILTLLGLSSVQSTSLQLMMSRNARDAEMAFQAAEVAILEAEAYIETLNNTVPFETPNMAGRYDSVNAPDTTIDDLVGFNWTTSGSNSRGFVTLPPVIAGVAEPPKYIIEYWRAVVSDEDRLNLDNIGQDTGAGRTQVFRISALGTGGTSTARVIIRTTYGKRF